MPGPLKYASAEDCRPISQKEYDVVKTRQRYWNKRKKCVISTINESFLNAYKMRHYNQRKFHLKHKKIQSNLSTNGHHWDPKNVVVIDRWSLFIYAMKVQNGSSIEWPFNDRWSLFVSSDSNIHKECVTDLD
jgi:hypothetical protein